VGIRFSGPRSPARHQRPGFYTEASEFVDVARPQGGIYPAWGVNPRTGPPPIL